MAVAVGIVCTSHRVIRCAIRQQARGFRRDLRAICADEFHGARGDSFWWFDQAKYDKLKAEGALR